MVQRIPPSLPSCGVCQPPWGHSGAGGSPDGLSVQYRNGMNTANGVICWSPSLSGKAGNQSRGINQRARYIVPTQCFLVASTSNLWSSQSTPMLSAEPGSGRLLRSAGTRLAGPPRSSFHDFRRVIPIDIFRFPSWREATSTIPERAGRYHVLQSSILRPFIFPGNVG